MFHQIIDNDTRTFITVTKKKIASNNDFDTLYKYAKDAINDDPSLKRQGYEIVKEERLKKIEKIKQDDSVDDEYKRLSLAVFVIENYPSDVNKLCKK